MKIGFIGLGIMGEAMCKNIVKKHDDTVYVYDKAEERVKLLYHAGARICEDSRQVAKQADVIISMVPTSEDSKKLYEEMEQSLEGEKVVIDMSTIDPEVSIEIANNLSSRGVYFLDAPVVKSRPAAQKGELGIYVGGNRKAYEKVKDILSYMGNNIIYLGKNGNGLIMKICHNTLVAQIQNGVNETLVLAEKSGINISQFAEAVSYGGGQNFYLDSKKNAIEKEDFTTAFSVQNMYKDLGILERLAEKKQVLLPGAHIAKQVYEKAVQYGYETQDFSATYKVVRKDNRL